MGFRRLLADWLWKGADIGGWNVTPMMSGREYAPAVSFKKLIDRYISWAYTCVRYNAVTCAQVPLRLYAAKPSTTTKLIFANKEVNRERRSYLEESPYLQKYVTEAAEVVEVVEHPFLDLLRNVNEFMNGFDLMEGLFSFQDLTGNAYWHLSRTGLGTPEEIWPLMPQYVKIVPSKEKFIDHYEFKVAMEKHIIDPEDIIHFKYFNPKDALYGMGAMEAAAVAVDLSNNMNLYETNLMVNRAHPDQVVVYPPDAGVPGKDEMKRVRSEWRKQYGGVQNAGRMGFLFGGADIKNVSFSPKEMAFLQGRKWSREEVCAVYGVPLSKVTTDSVNRANAEAGEYAYMKDTIQPKLRRTEQKLNEQLLPMFDERLFVAYDNPVPEDKEFRLKQTASNLTTGYSSINQERQIDGLDEVEWGEKPLLPANLIPVGSEPAREPQITEPKRIKAPLALPPLNQPTNFVNDAFVATMRQYYSDIERDVLAHFDRDAHVLKTVTKDRAADFASGWFDKQRFDAQLGYIVQPYIQETMAIGGERAMISLPIERQFDRTAPRLYYAMEQRRSGLIQSANSTTIGRLRTSLAEGMAEGEGVAQLRKRVEATFAGLKRHQSELIARTESIWAWNEGVVQGYKQSGVVEKMQWVSSGDRRTCDWCLDLDGTIISISDNFFDMGADPFVVNDREMSFGYSDVGHPPLHCQCRCTVVAVVEEF